MALPFLPYRPRLRLAASCFALVALSAASVWGQSPTYVRPPAPSPDNEFRFVARYMFTPDVSFRGLGNIDFGRRSSDESITGGLGSHPLDADGNYRTIIYDNGSIAQDFNSGVILGGDTTRPDGVPFVPAVPIVGRKPSSTPAGINGDSLPTTDGQTGNFGFVSNDQIQGTPGAQQLVMERYAAVANSSAAFEGDSGISTGWELQYRRFLGDKGRFSLDVGFSFDSFDSTFGETVSANLLIERDVYNVLTGTLDELDPALDGDGNPILDDNGDPVTRFRDPVATREEGGVLISLDPDQSGEVIEVENGAEVIQDLELRSAFYTLRAGPSYNLSTFKNRLRFNVGAGVSAVFAHSDYAGRETLILPGLSAIDGNDEVQNITRSGAVSNERDSQVSVAGYVDATAAFQVTERVSLFSGMQYQTGATDFTATDEARLADIDMQEQIYVHAGMGIRF